MRLNVILLLSMAACTTTSTLKDAQTDATEDPASTDATDDGGPTDSDAAVTDDADTDAEVTDPGPDPDPTDEDPEPDPTDDDPGDEDTDGDPQVTDEPDLATCHVEPRDPDRDRWVLYNRPYTAGGAAAYTWVARKLKSDLTFEPIENTVQAGRSIAGELVFTPDGDIALTSFNDGSIGAFRLGNNGVELADMQSVNAYAGGIVLSADGQTGWVLDGNWQVNGGGIYGLTLACDGTFVVDPAPAVEGRLIERGRLVPGRPDRMLLAGVAYDTSPAGHDLFLVDFETGALIASADIFADDDPIVGAMDVSPDGAHVVVGDTNLFSDSGERYAVAAIVGDTLVALQEVRGGDPVGIAASPFGDAFVILDGFGDDLAWHPYDPAANPVVGRGVIPIWGGRSPELPISLGFVEEGLAKGALVVAENVGLRLLQIAPGGALTDLGKTSDPGGMDAIVGIAGIQP